MIGVWPVRSSMEDLGSRLEYFLCARNFLWEWRRADRERPAIVRYAHFLAVLGMIFWIESISDV